MGFFEDCKEHSSVCGFGVLLGVVITMLLMYVYSYMAMDSSSGGETTVVEWFQDPNSMDPITQSLLKNKYRSDPIVTRIPASKEYLANQSEHPGLTAQLWK